MASSDEKSKPLEERLREWLDEEGYPLEFSTAHVFRTAGFSVRQGTYVRSEDSETPREVDVTASVDCSDSESLIRVYHVIECKWSQDKPWVVFTDRRGMGPAACVTQTISTLLGSAMLWKDAGLESLHKLDLFATPTRSGFNGRQAFS